MMTRILSAATLLAVLTTPTVAAQEWSEEQLAVWEQIQKAWTTWFSTDVDASYEYVHPDFTFWNSANAVPGNREIAYSLDSALFAAAGTKWHGPTVQPLTILVEGNIAVVHLYVRAFEESAGQSPKWTTTRWMEVYKKEGDKWMLLANYGDFN